MEKQLVRYLLAGVVCCACSQAGPVDVTTFAAPDSLGKSIPVSRQTVEGIGEVSFVSFGKSDGNIRLVTYFNDGTSVSEPLVYISRNELQAIDGAPRIRISGDQAVRLPGYAGQLNCVSMNVTAPAPSGEQKSN